MNTKRFLFGLLAVFILLEFITYLIHGVILSDSYASEEMQALFRPEDEMNGMLWIFWVLGVVWSFFFMFIFIKGYENKGIWEGVRYGIYMGLFFSLVGAYQSYTLHPLTYGIVLQWFIYGLIQSVILGITASLVYKPKEIEVESGAAAAA